MPSPLRVAFFAHMSTLSGADLALLELVRDLVADHGVRALVVLPADGPLLAKLAAAGAEVLVSPAPFPWWCIGSGGRLPPAGIDARMDQGARLVLDRLVEPVRAFRPDLVYTQTIAHPWGAVTAAVLGLPHVWMVAEHAGPDRPLETVFPLAATRAAILESSVGVLTLSRTLIRTHFPAAPPGRVEVVYQAFEDPVPHLGICPDGLYRRPGARRLAMFGGLSPFKGQPDAIRATARLVAAGRDLELLLAGPGPGPFAATLDALARAEGIADRVTRPGVLPDPLPAMRAADVVLVCTRSEGFGRVAIEALLLERPLVYSDAGDYVETFPPEPVGRAYRPGDVEGLAEAVAATLDDPAEARARTVRGRAFALQAFPRSGYAGKAFRVLSTAATSGRAAVTPPMLVPYLARASGPPPSQSLRPP